MYTKEEENEASQENLLGRVNASITDEERLFMDQQLSSQEIRNALMKMQKGKTPGADGITNELLSYFWDGLADFYDEVIREIYETGELTNSQKKGIIKITYKKNGRQYIKNYRPIISMNHFPNTTLNFVINNFVMNRLPNIPPIKHRPFKSRFSHPFSFLNRICRYIHQGYLCIYGLKII